MGLRIRTNVQSLTAMRNMGNTVHALGENMAKLSSGYRINKAADDAAGLAISESLRADIRSLGQAKRNANDAVSLVQVAEGGLNEIQNIMIRLRELSIQSASDTVGMKERGYLNKEFMALKDEIDRIAVSTSFNGTRLLTGTKDLDPVLLKDHNYSPLEIQVGKDYLVGPDSLDKQNPINIIKMNLSNMNATTSGEGSLNLGTAESGEGANVLSKEGAQMSIEKIDGAMKSLGEYRAHLGSIQSRLMSTDANLGIQIESLSLAKSRIKDADFAQETAEYTQNNILQQAAASVLSQANQLPTVALKLLNN